LSAIVCFVGCQRLAPTGTTVTGFVAFQGQPLAGGRVVFSPDPERGGHGKPISAETGPDGRFQLTIGADPTIPPGWYRVAIAPDPRLGSDSKLERMVFPAQLARPDRSGLVREVQLGHENTFAFIIEAAEER
jgi:hypothetical protein